MHVCMRVCVCVCVCLFAYVIRVCKQYCVTVYSTSLIVFEIGLIYTISALFCLCIIKWSWFELKGWIWLYVFMWMLENETWKELIYEVQSGHNSPNYVIIGTSCIVALLPRFKQMALFSLQMHPRNIEKKMVSTSTAWRDWLGWQYT